MRDKFFLVMFLLSASVGFAQVGINTAIPTGDLDVNGTLRLRSVKSIESGQDFRLAVVDSKGNIGALKKAELEIKREEVSVDVEPGESMNVINGQNYNVANIIVTSKNTCGRTMISSFQINEVAMLFINGVARDVLANVAVGTIDNGSTNKNLSAAYEVSFSGVLKCGGGNGTQFDFTFQKTGSNEFQIINNGNIKRTYKIIFQKIS